MNKSTRKETGQRKSTRKETLENHPQGQIEKAPTYYNQVVCVDKKEIERLLREHAQIEWCSSHRLNGLLTLLTHITSVNKKSGFQMSNKLAHDYCSQIKRPKNNNTVCSPLRLLIKIGVLEIIRRALWRGHLKQSTIYRLQSKYEHRKVDVKLSLSQGQARRRADAPGRKERRLNKRHPVRAGILDSLKQLSFSQTARPIIAKLDKKGTGKIVKAIDCQEHKCTFDGTGQATTPLSSLPRELKNHLCLSGQKAGFYDMSYAHHCFTPRIIDDRMEFYRKRHTEEIQTWEHCFSSAPTADSIRENAAAWLFALFLVCIPSLIHLARYSKEQADLIEFLSNGDFYSKWCQDGTDKTERDSIKKTANVLLNMPTAKAAQIPLYQKWKKRFPLSFEIIEDIKNSASRGHRGISVQLRHFMAVAMTAALKELQAAGIPAIPQTDAILCQHQHREAACKALGCAVFAESRGVCAMVGDTRYQSGTAYE